MSHRFKPTYSNDELNLKNQIDVLHNQWINQIVKNDKSTRKEELRELYVPDGFYPNYTNQRVKVLFIGKEGLELSGEDYITCLYNAYLKKVIGNKHINQHQFHYTMLYI